MAYYQSQKAVELRLGHKAWVDIAGEEILITNIEGSFYATSDRCGHMNGSLSMGKLEGKNIECPLHKARYDVTNCKCVSRPQMGGLEGVFSGHHRRGQARRQHRHPRFESVPEQNRKWVSHG